MDHKQQHHEHHRHEREAHKNKKKHEIESKFTLPVHPLWLLILGIILMLGVIWVWTFSPW